MKKLMTAQEVFYFCDGAHTKRDVQGWNTLKRVDANNENGHLDATVYQKGNRIVIAFAGTDPASLTDYRNAFATWKDSKYQHIPEQYGKAENLYNEIKTRYPNATIEFVGYSLGGTIANLLSHRTGLPSTALEPIGCKHIAKAYSDYFKYDDSNITTYGREGDGYFRSNLYRQSGNIYIIPNLTTNWGENVHNHIKNKEYGLGSLNLVGGALGTLSGHLPISVISHFLHEYDIDAIEKAKFYKPAEAWNSSKNTGFAAPISYNETYENLTLNDRIFHKGDIPMNIYYKENDDITQQDVDEFRAFVRQHSRSNGVIPTQ